MTQTDEYTNKMNSKNAPLTGIIVFLLYLFFFIGTWYVNGTDYLSIGKNAHTIKLWFAIPTLIGSTFLVVALFFFNNWKSIMFDASKAQPKWLWIFPITMAVIITTSVLQIDFNKVNTDVLLWVLLGGLGVGFGEEVATRGYLLVGFRKKYTEGKAWLYCTLLFSALHIPNVFFGLSFTNMLVQLVLTFIMGSGLYIVRRVSGNLILPIVLHGFWDITLFLSEATETKSNLFIVFMYPLAIICTVFIFKGKWKEKVS